MGEATQIDAVKVRVNRLDSRTGGQVLRSCATS